MKRYFFTVVFLMLSAGYSSPLKILNGVISFGGDEIKQDFYQRARNLLARIATNVPAHGVYPSVELRHHLAFALQNVMVVVKNEELFWEGQTAVAINYPFENPQKIEISAVAYNRLMNEKFSESKLSSLILHELLPLIGETDINYSKSNWTTDYIDRAYNGSFHEEATLDSLFLVIAGNPDHSTYIDTSTIRLDDFSDRDQFIDMASVNVSPSEWSSEKLFWTSLFSSFFAQIQNSNDCKNPSFNYLASKFKPSEFGSFLAEKYGQFRHLCDSAHSPNTPFSSISEGVK